MAIIAAQRHLDAFLDFFKILNNHELSENNDFWRNKTKKYIAYLTNNVFQVELHTYLENL